MKIIISDVGNAACAFVVANSGYVMMIDCGCCGDKDNPIKTLDSGKIG